MTLQIGLILGVMVIAYAIAKAAKLTVEISMFLAALAGGLLGAVWSTPAIGQLARHLVEGSSTYLDVIITGKDKSLGKTRRIFQVKV